MNLSNFRLRLVLILFFIMVNSCNKSSKKRDLNEFIYLETTIERLIYGYKNGDFKVEIGRAHV